MKKFIFFLGLFLMGMIVAQGPDFMVIGAMKAGTSTLYKCICQHPKIQRAKVKELHFFETDKYKTLGLKWYESQFQKLKSDEITGEGTVGYIYYPMVPKLVKKHYPKTKLILILRNPANRAYSHYQHRVRNMQEKRKFEEIVMPILTGDSSINLSWSKQKSASLSTGENILRRGVYIKQVENWLKYFDRSQLHIVIFEDFIKNPQKCMKGIYKFLGVNYFDGFNSASHNTYSYSKIKPVTRKFLVDFYKPFNKKLEAFLGRSLHWNF